MAIVRRFPAFRRFTVLRVALVTTLVTAVGLDLQAEQQTGLRFEVTVADGLVTRPVSGRLVVAVVPVDRPPGREPRLAIGRVGTAATPIFAVDVDQLVGGRTLVVGQAAAGFPVDRLGDLPAGDYDVQAVLDLSRDLRLLAAAGNVYSVVRRVTLGPSRRAGTVSLRLTELVPSETFPPDTDYVRFVRLRSALLSTFHGREVTLRAAVIVPRGFEDEPTRRYPLRVSVGGYGRRFSAASQVMREGSRFRAAWLADDAPRMIRLMLDGAGPYGDPYQVNSDNNGPYGDAITQELIPYVEERFRGIGQPSARVLDGESTGGWVSLALQIFYPDFFNGAWCYCPDGVDFRAFQVVNIYEDDNAYEDQVGDERPSRRRTDGVVQFTMRHELTMENVLGRGDSWTRSGRQWGAWNAVYGPRGSDGQPVPLWDPVTGVIDHDVSSRWERYDLRLVLARNWTILAPKLGGKINIWVGEMDDYYLNRAVHLLDEFLDEADPDFEARIVYGPGRGHCWVPQTQSELLAEMGGRLGARP